MLLYNQEVLPAKESKDRQDFLYPVPLIHIFKNRIMIRFCPCKNELNKWVSQNNYIRFINLLRFWYQSYFSFISSNSFRHSWIFTGSRYFKVDPLILFRFSIYRVDEMFDVFWFNLCLNDFKQVKSSKDWTLFCKFPKWNIDFITINYAIKYCTNVEHM